MINKEYLRNKLRKTKTCPVCGELITDTNFATIDHMYPKSLGGINHIVNYRFICNHCNLHKSNKLPSIKEIKSLHKDVKVFLKRLRISNTYNKEYFELLGFESLIRKYVYKKDNYE